MIRRRGSLFIVVVRLAMEVVPGDVVRVNAAYDIDQGCYVVDNSSDASITVNPDILISGTSIANSITCTRR